MRKNTFQFKRRRHIASPQHIQGLLDSFVLSCAKNPEQANFHELWSHWTMVLGDELAEAAKPLGVRNKTLRIGANNNLELQEIRMQYDGILNKTNAFMKAFGHDEFFEKLEFCLFQGKSPITLERELPQHLTYAHPPWPRNIGKASIDFKDNHALARCYEAYCEQLENEKQSFN